MTVSVFIGTSVDGFIARPNGELDFLPPDGGEAHGYDEFLGLSSTGNWIKLKWWEPPHSCGGARLSSRAVRIGLSSSALAAGFWLELLRGWIDFSF
jgi:hypothetical protein